VKEKEVSSLSEKKREAFSAVSETGKRKSSIPGYDAIFYKGPSGGGEDQARLIDKKGDCCTSPRRGGEKKMIPLICNWGGVPVNTSI